MYSDGRPAGAKRVPDAVLLEKRREGHRNILSSALKYMWMLCDMRMQMSRPVIENCRPAPLHRRQWSIHSEDMSISQRCRPEFDVKLNAPPMSNDP